MIRLLSFALVSLLLTGVVTSGEEPVGRPNPNVPELQVLQRFAGTWTATLANSDEQIRSTRRWTLGGYFLEHKFALASAGLQGVIYRGYDQRNSQYTLTFLDSQGNTSLLIGHWDPDLKAITFDAIANSCPIERYVSSFPDDSTEEWTIRIRGDQVVEVSGIAKKIM